MGVQGLGILHQLHRKGLHTVCIPRSVENDIAVTAISFGFNSALSVTIEMLNKAYQAAKSARKIAVVEVLGEQAGWIALQAGIAARANAVLIPEIPCTLKLLAGRLKDKMSPRRPYGLVVVAEGAKLVDNPDEPLRSGQAAETVAKGLLPLIAGEIYPLVIGAWARGGNPHRARLTVGDRLRSRGGSGAEGRAKRGDGGFCSTRHQVRSADRSDRKSQNRARRQRIHEDCPLARHLPWDRYVSVERKSK